MREHEVCVCVCVLRRTHIYTREYSSYSVCMRVCVYYVEHTYSIYTREYSSYIVCVLCVFSRRNLTTSGPLVFTRLFMLTSISICTINEAEPLLPRGRAGGAGRGAHWRAARAPSIYTCIHVYQRPTRMQSNTGFFCCCCCTGHS